MKYKVTELTTSSMKVEYDDGKWSSIPLAKTDTENTLRSRAAEYYNVPATPYDKVSDIPLALNFEGDTSDDLTTPITFDYKGARAISYPDIGDQMDAGYKARLGDSSEQTAIDVKIKAVKDKFPKDDKTYTYSDL